jgi:hypothetical protein
MKIGYDENWHLSVADPGRGQWQVLECTPGHAYLEGFGCENNLVVSVMGMQDGTVDIAILHTRVDSPHEFRQERVTTDGPDDHAIVEAKINEMLDALFAGYGG